MVGGLLAELTRPGLGVGDGREVRLFGLGQQPLGLGLPALGLGVRVGQHLVADAAGVADDRVARLLGFGDEAARLSLDLRQRFVPQPLGDGARVVHDAGRVGQQPVAVGQRVVAAAGLSRAVHAHLLVLGVGSFPLDCVVIGWRAHTKRMTRVGGAWGNPRRSAAACRSGERPRRAQPPAGECTSSPRRPETILSSAAALSFRSDGPLRPRVRQRRPRCSPIRFRMSWRLRCSSLAVMLSTSFVRPIDARTPSRSTRRARGSTPTSRVICSPWTRAK